MDFLSLDGPHFLMGEGDSIANYVMLKAGKRPRGRVIAIVFGVHTGA